MAELSGSTIKAYREWLQLAQTDFAELVGVSQSLISMVELGQSPVSRRLIQQIRSKCDSGILSPSFDGFLAEGGLGKGPLESEFGIIKSIPLEPWQERINLAKVADDDISDRISLPGLPPETRAFRFNPPPSIIAPDTIAFFRPAAISELTRDQIILVQLRRGQGAKKLRAGVGHIGRTIVSREGRTNQYQFEPADSRAPVIELNKKNVEILMACFFRGRHC
jgi:transcriptional regulator with XRE-family HTH domain